MINKILNYIKILSNDIQIQKLLIETVGNILSKQDNIDIFIKKNETKFIHIRDWISSVVENNEQWKKPRVLTLDALNNTADKYFEKKNNKIQKIELDKNHEKLIADLGEYYIVQMLTPEALDNESKVMQHCIGHGYYDKNLKYEEYQYLSLRDKFNKAHVTLEIWNSHIEQLQGKQNNVPDQKYLEKIIPWLLKNKYKIILEDYELTLNKNDNKLYSIYELPDNCEINGKLNFDNKNIEILPNNLTINGDLWICRCENFFNLPNNLIVNGNLNLFRSGILKIPEDTKVKNSLILSQTNISELPDNLTINGYLNLESSKNIKKLPNNLKVIDLNLTKTNITEIPDDIKIKKSLFIPCTQIKNIPKHLKLKLICVDMNQIDLIHEDLDFETISINFKQEYSKKDFFGNFKKIKFIKNEPA